MVAAMLGILLWAAFCWAGYEARRLTWRPFALALAAGIGATLFSTMLAASERRAQGRSSDALWQWDALAGNMLFNAVLLSILYLIGYAVGTKKRRTRRDAEAGETFE